MGPIKLTKSSKISIGMLGVLLIVLIFSHFQAYFYSKGKLDSIAKAFMAEEINSKVSCKTLYYRGATRPKIWDEVIAYEYTCLMQEGDGYWKSVV